MLPRVVIMKPALLFVLPVLLLAGCFSPAAPEDPGVLMPLKVGNRWIGEQTWFSPSGNTTLRDTLEIVAEQMINGEKWFVGSDGKMYINRSTGLYSRDTTGCDCFDAKYPARAGDSILLPDALVFLPGQSQPVGQIVVQRVVTTDTTIQVPAGRYSTYHFRPEIVEPKNARLVTPSARFYAPNVGPIRFERGISTDPSWRWELVKAEIGG
jgi:hypothetical protein